jgi:hypothetical protein
MKILKIKNYLLSNAMHLQFILAVLNLIGKFVQNLSKITAQTGALKSCADEEDRAFKIIRKSDLSSRKEESDQGRDAIFIGIKDVIKSLRHHFDANVRAAALRIQIVIDTYDNPKSLTDLPYDAETAAINNFLQELDNNYAADVLLTGLSSWIEELRVRNAAFEELTREYNEQQTGKSSAGLKKTRADADKAYKDVIAALNGLLVIEGEANYAPFVAELNTLIKHYNDLIAQHQGRLEASRVKDEESGTKS